ncbi:MAG: hypothetical protein PHI71_15365 [Acidiphilium sp.]|nr:hypothetical protein [Acidiphilium sp.]
MTDEPQKQAEKLAQTLRETGREEHASRFAEVLSGNLVGRALLEALRDVSDTVVAGVEALDPAGVAALEDFRLSLDRHLTPDEDSKPPVP